MKRLFVILLALLFGAAIAPSQQTARPPANRPPAIDSFTSSLRMIQICPFPTVATHDKPEVSLAVSATDPDGDSLNYEYSITEGTISGKGRSVVWDLHGLPRGPHEVRVTVTDGKGGKTSSALTVTTVDSSACDPPPPPCPVIKVSCPEEMDQAQPFLFSAVIEGDAKATSFRWKLNAGRIVKGQYSREIEASTKGADGFEKITATVEVGGFDPSCASTVVSCSTKIIR